MATNPIAMVNLATRNHSPGFTQRWLLFQPAANRSAAAKAATSTSPIVFPTGGKNSVHVGAAGMLEGMGRVSPLILTTKTGQRR
jgi:hypothetical protein